MARLFNLFAMRLSLFYVVFIFVSFALSLMLPSLGDVLEQHNESCYWMDAMLSGVKCGPDVYASSLQELFFNFWLTFLYALVFAFILPMTVLWKAILLFAPLMYLLVRYVLYVRQGSS